MTDDENPNILGAEAAVKLASGTNGTSINLTEVVVLEVDTVQESCLERSTKDDERENLSKEENNFAEDLKKPLLNLTPDLGLDQQSPECGCGMKITLETLTNEYKRKFDRFLKQNADLQLPEPALNYFHNTTSIKLLKKYDQMEKPGSLEFKSGYRKILEHSLIVMFSEALANYRMTRETTKAKLCGPLLFWIILAFALVSLGAISAVFLYHSDPEIELNTEKMDKVKREIYKLYHDQFQKENLNNHKTQLIPPEVSLEFHQLATQSAISKSDLLSKLIPTSSKYQTESKSFLNKLFRNRTAKTAVIGIHLGRNYSVSAVYLEEKIETIPHYDILGEIYNTLASYVGIGELDGCIGQCAKMFKEANNFSENAIDVSFIWKSSTKPDSVIEVKGRQYSVQNIVSKLLLKIRENAERFIGWPVDSCVITFSSFLLASGYSSVITEAGKIAGFQQVTVAEVAVAAGLTLEHKRGPFPTNRKWIFADLESQIFQVVDGNIMKGYSACFADNGKGGMALEVNMQNYFKIEYYKQTNMSWEDYCKLDSYASNNLMENIKHAINLLARDRKAEVEVSWKIKITQQKFQELAADSLTHELSWLYSCRNNQTIMEGVISGPDLIGLSKPQLITTFNFELGNVSYGNFDFWEIFSYGAAVMGTQILGKRLRKNIFKK